MSFAWVHENPPHWDANKAEIVGGAPDGIFQLVGGSEGQLLPGDWWRVEDDGVIGTQPIGGSPAGAVPLDRQAELGWIVNYDPDLTGSSAGISPGKT